jgi:hypothetical protein
VDDFTATDAPAAPEAAERPGETCSYLPDSPFGPPGSVSSEFIFCDVQRFLAACASQELDQAIESLDENSSFLTNSPFDALNWSLLVKSDLIGFLVPQVDADWAVDLVQARLICLAAILRYAPCRASADLGRNPPRLAH